MKRIIASLLMAVLVFTCIGVAASDYEGHWAMDAIVELIDGGIISGYDNGDVMPEGELTRAEFAALVNRAGDFTNDDALNFVDVSGDEWFAKELRIARAEGYMNGDDYDRANPNDTITRVEALVMISRAFFEKSDARYEFSDLKDIPEWARQDIMSLADYGVIKGFEDDSFRPHTPITRGQIFSVIFDVVRITGEENEAPMVEAARDPEPSHEDMKSESSSTSSGGSTGGSSSSGSSSTRTDSSTKDTSPQKEEPENKRDRFDIYDLFEDYDWFDNYDDYGGSSGSNNWDWWDVWSSGGSGSNSNEYGYDSKDEYGYDSHDEYGYDSYDEYGYDSY